MEEKNSCVYVNVTFTFWFLELFTLWWFFVCCLQLDEMVIESVCCCTTFQPLVNYVAYPCTTVVYWLRLGYGVCGLSVSHAVRLSCVAVSL